jgi:signal transduction histidine kinase
LLWSVEPGLAAEGDRELIAQAVINLLENAQRHTPAGTVIRLTLVAVGDLACIRVVDNGPGVPRRDLTRITQRFARLETSRGTAGYGLGLSLVAAVARLHDGRLVLKSAAQGLSATLELPLARSRSGATGPQSETIQAKETAK